MSPFMFAAIAFGILACAIGWLAKLPRASLPPHLLGHPSTHTEKLLTQDQVERLRALAKRRVFEINTVSAVVPNITHEHIGEAQPVTVDGNCEHKLLVPSRDRSLCVLAGRVDVGSHFIKTGGFDGMKENYLDMVSRVLSFGAYIFDLDEDPIFHELFDSRNFQAAAKSVCPPEQQVLDPFQFNLIMQVPGQSVALHIDSVHFWGANRFKFPEWLLAAMKFSGLWEDKFVHQIQTVSYFHEDFRDDRGGDFVYYHTANQPPSSIQPKPGDALSVDGSKTVHAAVIFQPYAKATRIDKSVRTTLTWQEEHGRWSLAANGTEVLFSEQDIRMSIVFRARCFKSEEMRAAFRSFDVNGDASIKLDDVLQVFRDDLFKLGKLNKGEYAASMEPGMGRLTLALRILDVYINYPLPEKAWVPFNWCAASMVVPALAPVLELLGC